MGWRGVGRAGRQERRQRGWHPLFHLHSKARYGEVHAGRLVLLHRSPLQIQPPGSIPNEMNESRPAETCRSYPKCHLRPPFLFSPGVFASVSKITKVADQTPSSVTSTPRTPRMDFSRMTAKGRKEKDKDKDKKGNGLPGSLPREKSHPSWCVRMLPSCSEQGRLKVFGKVGRWERKGQEKGCQVSPKPGAIPIWGDGAHRPAMPLVLLRANLCIFFLLPALRKKSLSVGSLDREGLKIEIGDQVLVAGQKQGVIRFYGKTDFAPGKSDKRVGKPAV